MINIKDYPIIKSYEIFPDGSSCIDTMKGIETENELEQYIKFSDLVYDELKLSKKK